LIIWINGAFGSGKTTSAYELHKRIPDSFVYDPENIGYFIGQNVPNQIKEDDFQDYPEWRKFNYELIKKISKEYHGIIIVPMTITCKQYYDEIIGRLLEDGIEVKHFILYANRSTLEKRLNKRLHVKESWGRKQIDRCIKAFDTEICNQKIMTDTMSIDLVIEEIACKAKINLSKDNRGKIRKLMNRIIVLLRHIR